MAAAEESAACQVREIGWARLFGVDRELRDAEELCSAITEAVPILPRFGYRLTRPLGRGAYGVTFVAHRRRSSRHNLPEWGVLKAQFICPTTVAARLKHKCGGYGQRANPEDTVRYESLMHHRIHAALEAEAGLERMGTARVQSSRASADGIRSSRSRSAPRRRSPRATTARPTARSTPLPVVPRPIVSTRMVIGERGRYPDVPPDGRRRLWVTLMEKLPGLTLRDAMMRTRDTLTPPEFVVVCRAVVRSLRRLHDLGHTHGDPHAANVMLVSEGALDPATGTAESWLPGAPHRSTAAPAAHFAPSPTRVALIDLERSIPRSFFAEAPTFSQLGAEVGWETARRWDLKIFCESVVWLAETCKIYNPRAPAAPLSLAKLLVPTPTTTSEDRASDPERLRRGVALVMELLDAYGGMDEGAGMDYATTWTARSLFLKHRKHKKKKDGKRSALATTTLPRSVAAEVRGIDVVAVDREEHHRFFNLLRTVQSFYARQLSADPRNNSVVTPPTSPPLPPHSPMVTARAAGEAVTTSSAAVPARPSRPSRRSSRRQKEESARKASTRRSSRIPTRPSTRQHKRRRAS